MLAQQDQRHGDLLRMQCKLTAQHAAVRVQLRRVRLLPRGDPCVEVVPFIALIGFEIEDFGSYDSVAIVSENTSVDDTSNELPIENLKESSLGRDLQPQHSRNVPIAISIAAQRLTNLLRFAVTQEAIDPLGKCQLRHFFLGQRGLGDRLEVLAIGAKIFDPTVDFFEPAMDEFPDDGCGDIVRFPKFGYLSQLPFLQMTRCQSRLDGGIGLRRGQAQVQFGPNCWKGQRIGSDACRRGSVDGGNPIGISSDVENGAWLVAFAFLIQKCVQRGAPSFLCGR